MLAATLLTSLLAACGGNSTSIVGAWVEPVPGMEGQVQGINIEEGGIADTMAIKKLTPDSLILDNQGMEIRYAKQK